MEVLVLANRNNQNWNMEKIDLQVLVYLICHDSPEKFLE